MEYSYPLILMLLLPVGYGQDSLKFNELLTKIKQAERITNMH